MVEKKQKEVMEKINKYIKDEEELTFYEHMVDSIEKLTFNEKICLAEYIISSISIEMEKIEKKK